MSACPSCPTSRSTSKRCGSASSAARLERVRVLSPFLLRSVEPPIDAAHGARVADFERLGKRIAIGFDNDVWLVLHLMIAGRLQWRADWPASFTRQTALALGFENGTLVAHGGRHEETRVAARRSRSRGARGARAAAGSSSSSVSAAEFEAVLKRRNHTLKRALTDPRLLSGIGNAYSDEILHRARLSPVTLTSRLTSEESRAAVRRGARGARRVARAVARRRRTASSRARSRRFTTRWPFTAGSASRARCAARRCSAFATRTTRRTIVRVARPMAACSPTARCRGC